MKNIRLPLGLAALLMLTGCYAVAPAPAPYYAAPVPQGYYVQPAPAYYYPPPVYYGAPVTLGIGIRGGGGYWRHR